VCGRIPVRFRHYGKRLGAWGIVSARGESYRRIGVGRVGVWGIVSAYRRIGVSAYRRRACRRVENRIDVSARGESYRRMERFEFHSYDAVHDRVASGLCPYAPTPTRRHADTFPPTPTRFPRNRRSVSIAFTSACDYGCKRLDGRQKNRKSKLCSV
jgi:hypothetical protein